MQDSKGSVEEHSLGSTAVACVPSAIVSSEDGGGYLQYDVNLPTH